MRRNIQELAERLLDKKYQLGLSWGDIARQLGKSEVYCAMLFYGYAQADEEEIKAISRILGMSEEELLPLREAPLRTPQQPVPPTDPFVYRLYELVILYGPALADVAHEKFGDGIMSAIDMKVDLQKVEEDGQERMLLTINGKWLRYKKF